MRAIAICLFFNLFVWHAGAQSKKALPVMRSFLLPNPFNPIDSGKNVKPSLMGLPASFYANNLSFFCRQELQVEKALKLPVLFRLGSVAYTNVLEGKNAAFVESSKTMRVGYLQNSTRVP